MFGKKQRDGRTDGDTLTAQPRTLRLLPYFLFAAIWLTGLLVLASSALTMGPTSLLFCSAALALPSALLSAQRAHVRRADALRHWREGSGWHRFLSGAAFRPTFSWLLATILMFGLVVHAAIDRELFEPFIWVAIVLPFGVWTVAKSAERSLKSPWFSFWTIGYGIGLTIFIVIAGEILFGAPPQETPASLAAARALYPCYAGSSALMDVVFEFMTFTAAIMSYGFTLAQSTSANWGTGLWLFTIFTQASFLLIIAFSLAAFLLPAPQLKLGLRAVGEDPENPKDPTRRLISQQTVTVIGLGFAGSWAIGEADEFSSENHLQLLRQTGTLMVEQIDNASYPSGTISFLEKLDERGRDMVNKAIDLADQEIAAAFKEARRGVEAYLDWHFSLSAEVARAIDSKAVAQNVTQRLGFAKLQQKADVAIARLDGATRGLTILKALADDALKTQKVAISFNRSRNVVQVNRSQLVPTLDQFRDPVPFKARVGIAGTIVVAGGLSGALLGRYISQKGVVRGATRITGSVVGSMLPVVGTAAGALVGVALATMAEWGMRKLNEKAERPKMRKQLLDQLTTEERKLRKILSGLRQSDKKLVKPLMKPWCRVVTQD